MTKPVAGRTSADFLDQVGDVPRMAAVPQPYGYQTPGYINAGQGGRTTKSAARLNMRAVADVLEGYDLDPIEEVAKVLVKEEPLLDKSGKPVLDENGHPVMKPALDTDTRLRALLELAQYSRPKLKSVEVSSKPPELSDEQIDMRLAALLERRAKDQA
jgi:hypothetical protein